MKIEMVCDYFHGRRRWSVVLVDGLTRTLLADGLDYLTALEVAIRWRIKNRVFGVPLKATRPQSGLRVDRVRKPRPVKQP